MLWESQLTEQKMVNYIDRDAQYKYNFLRRQARGKPYLLCSGRGQRYM